jgi:hypothetical protein
MNSYFSDMRLGGGQLSILATLCLLNIAHGFVRVSVTSANDLPEGRFRE